jgi:DNA invertase Pin-like site-specific DNA recombinase
VLVTTKMNRIGRSAGNLVAVTAHFKATGVDLVVLDQAIDTTPAGKLIFHVLSPIAEFEADLIRERTLNGIAATGERHGGRLPATATRMKPAKVKAAQKLLAAGVRGVGRAGLPAHRRRDAHGATAANLSRAQDRRVDVAGPR